MSNSRSKLMKNTSNFIKFAYLRRLTVQWASWEQPLVLQDVAEHDQGAGAVKQTSGGKKVDDFCSIFVVENRAETADFIVKNRIFHQIRP